MRSAVIKYPEMTKKISTPMKPPSQPIQPAWKKTTGSTATARRPSISGRYCKIPVSLATVSSLRNGFLDLYPWCRFHATRIWLDALPRAWRLASAVSHASMRSGSSRLSLRGLRELTIQTSHSKSDIYGRCSACVSLCPLCRLAISREDLVSRYLSGAVNTPSSPHASKSISFVVPVQSAQIWKEKKMSLSAPAAPFFCGLILYILCSGPWP